jgi:hypothetical protein
MRSFRLLKIHLRLSEHFVAMVQAIEPERSIGLPERVLDHSRSDFDQPLGRPTAPLQLPESFVDQTTSFVLHFLENLAVSCLDVVLNKIDDYRIA